MNDNTPERLIHRARQLRAAAQSIADDQAAKALEDAAKDLEQRAKLAQARARNERAA